MEESQENAARLDTVQYREMTRKLRNSPVSSFPPSGPRATWPCLALRAESRWPDAHSAAGSNADHH